MEKSEIKVSCNDQVLKITESPVLAAGGVNEVRVVFTFCEKWVGFAKTAVFYRDENEVYHAVLDENDTCVVPWEVCYEAGTFYFGVFGEKDDIRRTSNVVRYKVKNGVVASGMIPSAPSQEVYDQVMAEVAKMQETTKNNIKSIEKTGTEGLVDTYTITFVGGSTQTFTVTNGAQGIQGIQGEKGEKGDPGEKGEQGIQGVPGTNGMDGKDGVNGKDGVDGKDGTDGYTPVKGVDYFTPEEVQEIAEQAAELVDVPGGGTGGISAEEVQNMIDETVSAYAGVNVLYEYKQNADYQEIAEVDEDGYYCCYVKISTEVPEASSFIGKTVRYIKDHKGYTHDNSYVVTEDEIIQDMNGVYCIGDLWDVIVVLNNESEFASDGLTVGVWHISKIKYDNVDETTIWLQVVEPHVTSKDVQTMIDNSLGVIANGTY